MASGPWIGNRRWVTNNMIALANQANHLNRAMASAETSLTFAQLTLGGNAAHVCEYCGSKTTKRKCENCGAPT